MSKTRLMAGGTIAGLLFICSFVISMTGAAHAQSVQATVNSISATGVGPSIGTVTFADSKWGLMVTPDLSGLTPGVHGFHIHEKPACGPAEHEGKQAAGFAAGGHFDPANTKKHLGPYLDGHAGDLPPLIVNAGGKATLPVLAPRLTVKDVSGHSVMVHEGPDNFSDEPKPLGGGGGRIACGVIP
ncbi:MAG TPA: superoxide dismutase [Cu-Zn] SodC [Candidatus Binataceae bacterium]|nr:superoxide dismutase [Cu-Zn] SodC [Candidatus Binataceae bacterium]